jgi:hypothetical protein
MFTCPITKLSSQILAILYINDTDLLHINPDKDKSVVGVHLAIQNSVQSWGNLLIATDSALQLAKCFYSIMSFEWIRGGWRYNNSSISGNFGVTAPLPRGSSASIIHHPISHAEKTVGTMTSPDDDCSSAIQMMQSKAQ